MAHSDSFPATLQNPAVIQNPARVTSPLESTPIIQNPDPARVTSPLESTPIVHLWEFLNIPFNGMRSARTSRPLSQQIVLISGYIYLQGIRSAHSLTNASGFLTVDKTGQIL